MRTKKHLTLLAGTAEDVNWELPDAAQVAGFIPVSLPGFFSRMEEPMVRQGKERMAVETRYAARNTLSEKGYDEILFGIYAGHGGLVQPAHVLEPGQAVRLDQAYRVATRGGRRFEAWRWAACSEPDPSGFSTCNYDIIIYLSNNSKYYYYIRTSAARVPFINGRYDWYMLGMMECLVTIAMDLPALLALPSIQRAALS
jgi:hypothetical protein